MATNNQQRTLVPTFSTVGHCFIQYSTSLSGDGGWVRADPFPGRWGRRRDGALGLGDVSPARGHTPEKRFESVANRDGIEPLPPGIGQGSFLLGDHHEEAFGED